MDSNKIILNQFKVKIAIDTQILSYLVDKTYPMLNVFFEGLLKCDFVEVICSRFVTYEFIGIRKLEHYLREIHTENNRRGSDMNFSSIIRYKVEKSTDFPYEKSYSLIKSKVESDLEKINKEYDISYDGADIHKDLWKPHQDLLLSSTLSKEDSLILISSIFPDSFTREKHIIFLTNDTQFFEALSDKKYSLYEQSIEPIFKTYQLTRPHFYKITDIYSKHSKINLIKELNSQIISDFIKPFIIEHMVMKSIPYHLGYTVRVNASKKIRKNLVCFELNEDIELFQNIYIVIISKELDFQYSHSVSLSEFWSTSKIVNYPYVVNTQDPSSKRISVRLVNQDGDDLDKELLGKITSPGNLVFLHPDSFY